MCQVGRKTLTRSLVGIESAQIGARRALKWKSFKKQKPFTDKSSNDSCSNSRGTC